ncbi:MAG: DUF4907 domain-containing protein [Chitinophagaceae bacterium]|nr:DUF4907 domain-containing protein [Chitinophagaceae bacterium]
MKLKTSKKKILIISLLAIAAIAGGLYTRHYYRQHEMVKVEIKPFKTGKGWGYNVMVDKKIYIHQETIPAFAGNQSFTSEDDAVKAGNLVVKKMIAGNMLPSLTAEEVVGLGIHPIPSAQ